MTIYDPHTLRLFGLPVFTLTVAVLFVAAFAGLLIGIARWNERSAKIIVIASTLLLVIFALAAVFVLITVWSGSMG